MDRRKNLLQRLDRAWREFLESYAGLPEAELLEPNVIGAWSVKDIIAHLTSWEEEALKHLQVIAEGRRPPRYSLTHGGIDAFNAQTMERRKALSLAEALKQQMAVHKQLIALVEDAVEDQLGSGTRFQRRLRLDTYGHYAKHVKAIRSWRARRFSG
ncbi:MAG: DinB family protein [Terriglobia bacterium]